MAIIYSYPEKITPADGDFLVITDSEQPAPNKNRTKSLKIENLADYIVSSTSGITGSGTLNTIAMFTPNGQRIGDSFITQTASPDAVNVSARFNVSPGGVNALNVSQTGGTTGAVTIPGTLNVRGTYYDAAGDEGTDGDVLVAKGTPGNMVTRWVSKAATGIATGSGTTDFVPKFTDGPNGVIGDSFIKSYVAFPGTGNEQNIVEINPTAGANPNLLIVNTGRFSRIETDTIIASDTGSVTMNGNVNIGNASTDELNIASTTNIWNAPVKAGPTPFGALAPGADYVLASTASSTLDWKNIADISGSVTGSGTTDTIPIWTDGPNGILGDSIITYDNTFVPKITIGPQPSRLEVDGDLTVTNRATFSGPYARFDTLIEVNSTIQDGSSSSGTTGQVLTSTGTGVAWDDATDVVSGAIAKLIPFNVTASPGGSSAYNADNNIVEISWTTGNGTYVLFLPTATGSNAYRNIRFVTNGTFPGGASHKIEITALPGETVDGAAFFEISKTYEGVSLWSNGTEWIVIQAKAH